MLVRVHGRRRDVDLHLNIKERSNVTCVVKTIAVFRNRTLGAILVSAHVLRQREYPYPWNFLP